MVSQYQMVPLKRKHQKKEKNLWSLNNLSDQDKKNILIVQDNEKVVQSQKKKQQQKKKDEQFEKKMEQSEKKQQQWKKKFEQEKRKQQQLEKEYKLMLEQNERKRKQLIQKALRSIRGPTIKPIEQQQKQEKTVGRKAVPQWMLKETLVDPTQKIQKAKEAFLMPKGKLREKMGRYGIFA